MSTQRETFAKWKLLVACSLLYLSFHYFPLIKNKILIVNSSDASAFIRCNFLKTNDPHLINTGATVFELALEEQVQALSSFVTLNSLLYKRWRQDYLVLHSSLLPNC